MFFNHSFLLSRIIILLLISLSAFCLSIPNEFKARFKEVLVKAWYISSTDTSIKENQELMKTKNQEFFLKTRESINISQLAIEVEKDYTSWTNEVQHSPLGNNTYLDKACEKIDALYTLVLEKKEMRDKYMSNNIRLRKCIFLDQLIEQLQSQINPQPRKQKHLTLTSGISQII